MKTFFNLLGQGLAYLLFAVIIGYFSTEIAYAPMPPEHGLIKLSFNHPGKRIKECRKRVKKELAKMAPNMRTALDCPRRRHPVRVELSIDGRRVFAQSVVPSGLAGDGHSQVYERFPIPAGIHLITARLNGDAPGKAADHTFERRIPVRSGQVLVVGFDHAAGFGFK